MKFFKKKYKSNKDTSNQTVQQLNDKRAELQAKIAKNQRWIKHRTEEIKKEYKFEEAKEQKQLAQKQIRLAKEQIQQAITQEPPANKQIIRAKQQIKLAYKQIILSNEQINPVKEKIKLEEGTYKFVQDELERQIELIDQNLRDLGFERLSTMEPQDDQANIQPQGPMTV